MRHPSATTHRAGVPFGLALLLSSGLLLAGAMPAGAVGARAIDVMVSQVNTTSSAMLGSSFVVNCTIENIGSGQAPTFQVSYSYVNQTNGSDIVEFANITLPPLKSGFPNNVTGANGTFDTSLYPGLQAGNVTIIVRTIVPGDTNATNDARSRVVLLIAPPMPQLAVTAISADRSTATIGETVTVTATVENTGPANATGVTLRFRLDGAAANDTIVGVLAGANTTALFVWNTTGTLAGNHTVSAELVGWNSSMTTGTITLVPPPVLKPDLVLAGAVAVPDAAMVGTAVRIMVTIRNAGPGLAPPAEIEVIQAFPVISPDLVGRLTSASLAVNAPWTGNLSWDTSGRDAGKVTLQVFVDRQAKIAEANESNNKGSLFVNLTTVPDYTVTALSLLKRNQTPPFVLEKVADARTDDVLLVRVTVANIGTAAAPLTANVTLAIDADGTTVAGTRVALGPGRNATLDLPFPADRLNLSAPRNVTIRATADAGGNLTESDETNNVATRTVRLTPAPRPPDLTVTALSALPSPANLTDLVTVRATIMNRGGGPAVNFTTSFLLRVGNTTELVGDLPGQSVDPGASIEAVATWSPGGHVAGGYTLVVRADAGNRLPESDESNNERSVDLTLVDVLPPPAPGPAFGEPDIRLDPAAPLPGQEVGVSVTMTNGGAGAALDTVLVILIDGKVVGNFSVGTLGPGQSRTFTVKWTAHEGDHVITVIQNARNAPAAKETELDVPVRGQGAKVGADDLWPLILAAILGTSLVLLLFFGARRRKAAEPEEQAVAGRRQAAEAGADGSAEADEDEDEDEDEDVRERPVEAEEPADDAGKDEEINATER